MIGYLSNSWASHLSEVYCGGTVKLNDYDDDIAGSDVHFTENSAR